jgi:hypothetical protein
MPIDTREELINALHEACEVEHALLVQYLYTALSLKKGLNEGLTTHQQRMVRDWEMQILLVAREEMGHFAIVCNLLAAIGAPAKFGRPPMPRKIDYYPFPFDLMPFGDEALYRFLIFELPRGMPKPPPPGADLSPAPMAAAMRELAPEPIEFEFVGELYAKIAEGFRSIPEELLFIGPPEAQTDNRWSDNVLDIRPVTNRATALAAIENIIRDGEGTPDNRASSHFARFLRIRQQYFDEGRFSAARDVPVNPATRRNVGASGDVVLITHPTSLAVAELFNGVYGLMLLLLQVYFSLAPAATDAAARTVRQQLRLSSQRLMSVALRPIAEELTKLPLAAGGGPERAGPPYEIYSEIFTPPYAAARWKVVIERFDGITAECRGLSSDVARLGAIGETIDIMKRDLLAVTTEDA